MKRCFHIYGFFGLWMLWQHINKWILLRMLSLINVYDKLDIVLGLIAFLIYFTILNCVNMLVPAVCKFPLYQWRMFLITVLYHIVSTLLRFIILCYVQDFDPVRHVLEHIPEENELAYFEEKVIFSLLFHFILKASHLV